MMPELEKAFREANKHLPEKLLNDYTAIYMMGVEIGIQYALDKVLLLNYVPLGFTPRTSLN